MFEQICVILLFQLILYTYIVNRDFYICCKKKKNTIKWINLWSLIIDEKWYTKKWKKFEYFVNIYVN